MSIELDEDIITGLKILSTAGMANVDHIDGLDPDDLALAEEAMFWIEELPENLEEDNDNE